MDKAANDGTAAAQLQDENFSRTLWQAYLKPSVLTSITISFYQPLKTLTYSKEFQEICFCNLYHFKEPNSWGFLHNYFWNSEYIHTCKWKRTGSGIQSKQEFLFGKFDMRMIFPFRRRRA
ncbi:hypothetical protein SUGI_0972810 [Cryptomeria japonica]|nr:hypothetical protein SUGI_0972810 [Cryptomeria japonica]